MAIRLISLGLHITDRCNARCKHCAYGCDPHTKGAMTLDEAREYLGQVAEHPVEVVCISGGEPFLCHEVLLGIVKAAREMGIPGIWAFTNGYWATSIEAARQRLLPLKKAGMTRLSLSADAFHQEFIPLERVRDALLVARELGLELELDMRFLGPPEEKNPTNLTTKEIIARLGDLTKVMVHRGQPLYIGEAAERLSHLVEQKPGIPEGRCEGMRKHLRPHYPHLLAPHNCYPRRGSDHDHQGNEAFLHP